MEEETKIEEVSPTPALEPALNKPGFKFNFRLTKKQWLFVVLPVVIIGLFIYGLFAQGVIGGARSVQATLNVVNEEQEAVDNAQVIIGETSGATDESGNATITGLKKGETTLSIRKTGFVPMSQQVTLKRGQNTLGTFTLKEAPVTKIDTTLRVNDYIAESPITDATVTLGDLKPIYKETYYAFTDVPIGVHKLVISKSGYITISKDIIIAKETKEIETAALVPVGSVVFESNRDRGKRGIYTANYDGSQQKSLVGRVGDYEDYTPILGPNQRKVFFTSTRDGLKRENDPTSFKEFMYLVDIDGKNLTKISEISGSYATWSPDGGYIGFTKYTEGYTKSELFTYNVVSKTSHQFSGYNSNSFAFSQDGKQLAFGAKKDNDSTNRLFFSNADGTNIKEIAAGNTVNSYYGLGFTADGKIRYSYWTNNVNKYYEYVISTGETKEISAPVVDREGGLLSPNKKLRAYISTRDGKANVFISDPDGKNEKKLTELNKAVGGILWSKDSSFVMFNYRTEGESSLYLVSTNGTAKAKKIVDINLTYYY